MGHLSERNAALAMAHCHFRLGGGGGQGGNIGYSHSLRDSERTDRQRPSCKPGATGRQCDWDVLNKVALSVQINMKADLREIYGALDPCGGHGRDRHVRRQIRRQVRQGGRLPDEGSRSDAARLLRLPSRALGHQIRSKRVCDGAASNRADKGSPVGEVNAAAKTWQRLKGENQLPKVLQRVKFQTASRSSA